VGGYFDCSNNPLLTSLKGAPSSVGENFNCSNNQLKSLKYAPSYVGGSFYCSNNQLTSLEYAPSYVGEFFYCSDNPLLSDIEIETYKQKLKENKDKNITESILVKKENRILELAGTYNEYFR